MESWQGLVSSDKARLRELSAPGGVPKVH